MDRIDSTAKTYQWCFNTSVKYRPIGSRRFYDTTRDLAARVSYIGIALMAVVEAVASAAGAVLLIIPCLALRSPLAGDLAKRARSSSKAVGIGVVGFFSPGLASELLPRRVWTRFQRDVHKVQKEACETALNELPGQIKRFDTFAIDGSINGSLEKIVTYLNGKSADELEEEITSKIADFFGSAMRMKLINESGIAIDCQFYKLEDWDISTPLEKIAISREVIKIVENQLTLERIQQKVPFQLPPPDTARDDDPIHGICRQNQDLLLTYLDIYFALLSPYLLRDEIDIKQLGKDRSKIINFIAKIDSEKRAEMDISTLRTEFHSL